jgi:hypothetical protein
MKIDINKKEWCDLWQDVELGSRFSNPSYLETLENDLKIAHPLHSYIYKVNIETLTVTHRFSLKDAHRILKLNQL